MKVRELNAVLHGRLWCKFRDRWTNNIINPNELSSEEYDKFWEREVYQVYPGDRDDNNVQLLVYVD